MSGKCRALVMCRRFVTRLTHTKMFKLAALVLLAACEAQDADKWTKWCTQRTAGQEVLPSGSARLADAIMVSPRDHPAIFPDPARHPECFFPARINPGDEREQNGFIRQWEAAGASKMALRVSGSGQWKKMEWGHLQPNFEVAFVFDSITVHGPAEKLDAIRQGLADFGLPPQLSVAPRGYLEIGLPNDAMEECVRMIEGIEGDGTVLERRYFWSESQGGIVEMIFEGKAGGFPFKAIARCVRHPDGSMSLWNAPADMDR